MKRLSWILALGLIVTVCYISNQEEETTQYYKFDERLVDGTTLKRTLIKALKNEDVTISVDRDGDNMNVSKDSQSQTGLVKDIDSLIKVRDVCKSTLDYDSEGNVVGINFELY